MSDNPDAIIGDMEDRVTCWICFEIFNFPCTLDCNHSFCKECIEAVYKKNPLCAFCRRPFGLPLPGINGELQKLVDRFKNPGATTPTQTIQIVDLKAVQGENMLFKLPDELLVYLVTQMHPRDALKLGCCCKDLRRVVEDPIVWRDFCTFEFPFVSVQKYNNNWKKAYAGCFKAKRGWDTGKPSDFKMFPMRGHTNYINCFDFYRNNIVSGSSDSTVKIWRVDSEDCLRTLNGHSGIINDVRFNEVHIASAATDSTVRIWDANSGLILRNLPGHNSQVNSLAFNGNTVYSGSDDNTMCQWDIRTGARNSLIHCGGQVKQLQFDNNNLIARTSNGIDVFDVKNLKLRSSFPLRSQCFQLYNNKILAGVANNVHEIDIETREVRQYASQNHAPLNDVRCDGKKVIAASNDGNLYLWNYQRYATPSILKDHTGPVHVVQLGEKKAVSASADNTIKVWDLKTNNRMYSLLGGSLQKRANNPEHPSRPGISGMSHDTSRIVASINSMLRVYSFEDV